MQIRVMVIKVITAYRSHKFFGFVKAASIHLLKEWRFSPYTKGITFRKGKAGQIKVLYVDTISGPQAKSNVNV